MSRATPAKPFTTSQALRRLTRAVVLVAAFGGHDLSQATPSVPWTPSAAGRHYLELLVDGAGLDLPITQWPLPRDAVRRALDALPADLSPAMDEARSHVLRELDAQRASRLFVKVRSSGDTVSGFGDDATPGSSIGVRSSELNGNYLALQVGGRIDLRGDESGSGPRFRLDDSALVTEAQGIQLQAWSHRSWWGPGWQSALALSNNAPAFNGLGFQRASASTSDSRWLSWLGPWNFDFFVAQTDDVTDPANPYLVGQRFTFRPFSHLEVGLTHNAQWGGRGRPQSPKSFWDMLISSKVNADTVSQQALDPANELGGFDLRLRCFGDVHCAGYIQLIGEDQAGWSPSHYLGLYGFETWSADGRQRYYAEYAETGCHMPIGRSTLAGCAYRNYAYPQGFTSAGRWIGASVGPDSRVVTLGWLDAAGGTSLRLNAGRIGSRIGTFSPLVVDPESTGRLLGLSARQTLQWGAMTITPELDWQRVDAAVGTQTTARIGASMSMSLDSQFEAASGHLGASLSGGGSSIQPLLVAAGLIGGAALLDHTLDNYAQAHGDNPSARALIKVGNAVPVAGMALAGLSWLAQGDTPQRDLAFASVSSGIGAAATAEVAKYLVDRDRPRTDHGAGGFGDTPRAQSSFPSIHSAVAWAVVTPYAKYYDAPWLYGMAALTNAGRVMSREHWLSDTVGGAALGYVAGDFFYRRSGAADDATQPRLWISPRSVLFQFRFH